MGPWPHFLMISVTILFWVSIEGSSSSSDSQQSRDSLDFFIYHHCLKGLFPHPRTSRPYSVDLRGNFSGIGVSFIRLRASTLWRKGANHNPFHVPKHTHVWPFSRRVDLVYQNLGNLSSFYYHVPGHTIISPVLGLLVYNNSKPVELRVPGGDADDEEHRIVIQFPSATSGKCVRFDPDGKVEFRKVIGIVVGAVGILVICTTGAVLWRKFRWKKVKKMETQSERSESLGTTWVGSSRMPSAPTIRTQPAIENTCAP